MTPHPRSWSQNIPYLCVEYPSFLPCPHFSAQDKDFVFEDAVKNFNIVFSAVKTGRSLAASYSLQNDVQCKHPMGAPIPLHDRCSMVPSVCSGSIGPRSQIIRIASTHNRHVDQRLQEPESCQGHQRHPCWMWLRDPHTHYCHTRPRAGRYTSINSVSTPSQPLELLQGLIDFDVEIAKCEKKLNLARLNLEKVQKVESQPDYEETVPENVRLINEDKV